MHFVRKVFLGLAGTALVFFLFVAAIDASLVRVLGSPGPIKHILSASGLYDSAVPSVLDETKTQTGTAADIPLNEAAIITAAKETFSPQFVQTNVEKLIDGTFDWLNGQSAEPDFRLDLSSAKTTFADKVAQIAKDRAASLPVCTTLPSGPQFDVFNATCVPRGITPEQAASEAKNTILNGKGFIDNPVITADSLKSEGSNKSIFDDQLKNAPAVYRDFKTSALVLGLLALLSLAAVVFLSQTRLKGLKHAGFILISSGVILILLGLAINTAIDNKVIPKISFTTKVLQNDVRQLTRDSVTRVDNGLLAFGGGYAVIGVLGVGGSYWAGRRQAAQPPAAAGSAGDKMPRRPEPAVEPAKPKTKTAAKKIDVK